MIYLTIVKNVTLQVHLRYNLPVQLESGNLRVVTLKISKVEVVGEGLLIPRKPETPKQLLIISFASDTSSLVDYLFRKVRNIILIELLTNQKILQPHRPIGSIFCLLAPLVTGNFAENGRNGEPIRTGDAKTRLGRKGVASKSLPILSQ